MRHDEMHIEALPRTTAAQQSPALQTRLSLSFLLLVAACGLLATGCGGSTATFRDAPPAEKTDSDEDRGASERSPPEDTAAGGASGSTAVPGAASDVAVVIVFPIAKDYFEEIFGIRAGVVQLLESLPDGVQATVVAYDSDALTLDGPVAQLIEKVPELERTEVIEPNLFIGLEAATDHLSTQTTHETAYIVVISNAEGAVVGDEEAAKRRAARLVSAWEQDGITPVVVAYTPDGEAAFTYRPVMIQLAANGHYVEAFEKEALPGAIESAVGAVNSGETDPPPAAGSAETSRFRRVSFGPECDAYFAEVRRLCNANTRPSQKRVCKQWLKSLDTMVEGVPAAGEGRENYLKSMQPGCKEARKAVAQVEAAWGNMP